jgi:hypothetical protein
LRRAASNASLARMRLWLVAALTIIGPASAGARPLAPLYDPVTLNIGLACQWQHHCIDAQVRAMKHARSFVARRKPPPWRIHQCNRNAARSGHRVDWVGFDNCIRNARLRRPR